MRREENESGSWVLSIKDMAPQGCLAFDLSDILECLMPTIGSYVWVAFGIDCLGQSFVAEGEWLTSGNLLERSKSTQQTIDGTFLAYKDRIDLATARRDYEHSFVDSDAVLAILAVDSTLFEVYTKIAAHIPLLRSRFLDVVEQDPNEFFW
jgi:hypothetical protein